MKKVEKRNTLEFVENFFNGIHVLCDVPFEDEDFQEILDKIQWHEFVWNESISDEKLTTLFIEYAKENFYF